jgi:hypothetical protein
MVGQPTSKRRARSTEANRRVPPPLSSTKTTLPPRGTSFLFVVCSGVKMQNPCPSHIHGDDARSQWISWVWTRAAACHRSPRQPPAVASALQQADRTRCAGAGKQGARRHLRWARSGCAAGIMASSGNALALRRTALVAPQHKRRAPRIIRPQRLSARR